LCADGFVDPERGPLMTANIGTVDRAIRFLLAFVVVILLVTRRVHGVLAIVLGVVGGILLVTAFIRFCGLYPLLKISTIKKAK
jgi:hypothetical protein